MAKAQDRKEIVSRIVDAAKLYRDNKSMKKVKETRKPYPTDLTDTQWGDHELQHVGWVNKGRCNNGAAG